jgi:hypothetical protein
MSVLGNPFYSIRSNGTNIETDPIKIEVVIWYKSPFKNMELYNEISVIKLVLEWSIRDGSNGKYSKIIS